MKQLSITTAIKVAKHEELSEQDRALVDAAREATHRSYAPYSHFNVGAAIALDNGEIVTGANQENVAYPSGTCAERTACFYAHARYPDARFTTIAIAARGTDGNEVANPIAPCGACRQTLIDVERRQGQSIRVIMAGEESATVVESAELLLPFTFKL